MMTPQGLVSTYIVSHTLILKSNSDELSETLIYVEGHDLDDL